jgi:hypothetical protein
MGFSDFSFALPWWRAGDPSGGHDAGKNAEQSSPKMLSEQFD